MDYQKLRDMRPGEPSTAVRARVEAARACQRERFAGTTIADLAGSEDITQVHLAEALQYRPTASLLQ